MNVVGFADVGALDKIGVVNHTAYGLLLRLNVFPTAACVGRSLLEIVKFAVLLAK